MPPDHGARLNDDERASPSRPKPEHRDPEGPVERREAELRFLRGVRCDLLTQCEFNDRLVASTSNQSRSAAGNEYQELEDGLHEGREFARP